MRNRLIAFCFFLVVCLTVFFPFIKGNLPIPTDTLVGLYHPFRDFYASDYPNGIPFKNFLITDPIRQQYPWRFLAIEELKNLQLPLWNPYTVAGTPLLGNIQSAPLYPLNIFFFILPFAYSWSFLVFLQPVLMGIFLFWYLRYLKISTLGSLIASIAYAFSGFSVSWMEWNTVVQTALWLPLILLAKEHLLRKMTLVWALALIFAEISQIYAGHIQVLFYSLSISSLYLLFRIYVLTKNKTFKDSATQFIKTLLPFVGFGFIIISIGLLQLLPAFQFILLSARNVDQVWTEPGWFIPFTHLSQFIVPDLFGNPTTLNYFGTWNYAELVGYVGIIPFTFAFFAMFFVRRKIVYFFTAVFFLCLLFATDNSIAHIPFELSLPFLSTSQPTRLLFLIDFSLVIMTAFGIDFFQKHPKKFLLPLGLVGGVLVSIWVVISLNSFSLSIENLMVSKRNLYLPSTLFLSLLFVYLVTVFTKGKRVIFFGIVFLLLLTTFDSFRFAQKFLPFTNQSYLFPTTKTLSFLQKQTGVFRIASTDSRILPPNTSIIYRLQTIEGYDPLYLLSYGEFISAIQRGKPDISAPFGFNRIITPQNVDPVFLNLLGVKYMLALNDQTKSHLEKIFEEGETRVYKNTSAFERAFSVKNIKPVSTKQEAISELFKNKEHLSEVAVTEGYSGQTVFSKANVSITSYTPSKVILRVESTGRAFIVLMDSYYPSWKARLEGGGELKIYKTNYNFRGIVVPEGEHTVEFINTLF